MSHLRRTLTSLLLRMRYSIHNLILHIPVRKQIGLVINRKDGLHFEGAEELAILANAWNESLDANFFSTVPPAGPAPVPSLTASCVTENNAVSISLPAGYASYEWSNGAKEPVQ
jgi:hypothetical protein